MSRFVAGAKSGWPAVRPAVVLFDAVGTILVPRPSAAEVYARVAHEMGSALTGEQIARRFSTVIQARSGRSADPQSERTSEAGEREYWKGVVREVLGDVAGDGRAFDRLWSHFAQPCHWSIEPGAREAWGRLRTAGFRTGVCSNFDERLLVILAAHEWFRDSPILISSQLGWRKPAKRFFEAAEERLGLRGPSILLVGDHPTADYDGAAAAGWQALLVDRAADDRGPRLAIPSLFDLAPCLGA